MHTLEKGVRATRGLNGAINVRAEAELGQCVRLMQPMRAFKLEGSSADDGVRRRAKCCREQEKTDHVPRSSHEFFISIFDLHFVPFALQPAPCISRGSERTFHANSFLWVSNTPFFNVNSHCWRLQAECTSWSGRNSLQAGSKLLLVSIWRRLVSVLFILESYNIEENSAKISEINLYLQKKEKTQVIECFHVLKSPILLSA